MPIYKKKEKKKLMPSFPPIFTDKKLAAEACKLERKIKL